MTALDTLADFLDLNLKHGGKPYDPKGSCPLYAHG
jgi:hypothetical protein